MGQRSQIYVRGRDKYSKKTYLVARYFQWNYAERMIARARHGIQWMRAHMDFLSVSKAELSRIFDVNFDMHDIVISYDLIQEWKDCGEGSTINDYIFHGCNNDGRLFIDVNEKTGKIKYCFTDYDNKYLGDASAYIAWELEDCREDYNFEKEMKRINQWDNYQDNLKYLQDNAELMTAGELRAYLRADYSDMEDKPLF